MRFFAFDTETHHTQPGLLVPPVVCASYAYLDAAGRTQAGVVSKAQATPLFREHVLTADMIVGVHIAYDLAVMAQHVFWTEGPDAFREIMAKIFAKFDAGQVWDCSIAQALHDIAHGKLGEMRLPGAPKSSKEGRYSLQVLTHHLLGRAAKEHDEWRLKYHVLEPLPLADWPPPARLYPVDDAVNTLHGFLIQIGYVQEGEHWIPTPNPGHANQHDMGRQVGYAFAVHLGAAWGFWIDPQAVNDLEHKARTTRDRDLAYWQGLQYVTPKGTQSKAKIKREVIRAYTSNYQTCFVCEGQGHEAPRVLKSGKLSTAAPKPCKPCQGTGILSDASSIPLTDKGEISTSRDTLLDSGDENLMKFASFLEHTGKVLTTYLPWLRFGMSKKKAVKLGLDRTAAQANELGLATADTFNTLVLPVPRTLAPNPLVKTGRGSYEDPTQTFPQRGGERECAKHRPRRLLSSSDYGSLEMLAHAQSCLNLLGKSKLADLLLDGKKPHNILAADMLSISYEEYNERYDAGEPIAGSLRKAAKIANFGFLGFMTAPTMILSNRTKDTTVCADGYVYQGIRFCVLMQQQLRCGKRKTDKYRGYPIPPVCADCLDAVTFLHKTWIDRFDENKEYRAMIKHIVRSQGSITQHYSGRIRGGVTDTEAANGYFQGLAADGAKRAAYLISKESFTDHNSPLYGTRLISFVHDETINEVYEATAHEAVQRVEALMKLGMSEVLPDLMPALTVESALMHRWSKKAKPIHVNGRLVPYDREAV